MRVAIVLVAMTLASSAWADSLDISARRLLSTSKGDEPNMHRLAEVIASAFASGLDWSAALGGRKIYCPSPGLTGADAMSALERFLDDNPDMADRPYGDAMAATLSRAFPCKAL